MKATLACLLACMLAATAVAQCPATNPPVHNILEYCPPQSDYNCADLQAPHNSGTCLSTNCDACKSLTDPRSRANCLGCVKAIVESTKLTESDKCNLVTRCTNVRGDLLKTQCICGLAVTYDPPTVNPVDIANFVSRCEQCTTSPSCACVLDIAAATANVQNGINCVGICFNAPYLECPSGTVKSLGTYCEPINGQCTYHPYYNGLCVQPRCNDFAFNPSFPCPSGCLTSTRPDGTFACIQNYDRCGPTPPATSAPHPPCLSDADCNGQVCTCSWCGSGGDFTGFVCAPKCTP